MRKIYWIRFASFKAFKYKFTLRTLAVFDVLFAHKFELKVWDKEGQLKARTRFCKTEINEKL
jgi:hypothetical protein